MLSGWLVWKLQQRACRKAVKTLILEGLPDRELVLLAFHKEEVKLRLKFDDEQEFELSGQMYDIVRQQQSGDSVYFWCWADDRETVLQKQFEEHWHTAWGSSPQRRRTETSLQSWIALRYLVPESLQWQQVQVVQTTVYQQGTSPFLKGCIIPPVSPPPEYN